MTDPYIVSPRADAVGAFVISVALFLVSLALFLQNAPGLAGIALMASILVMGRVAIHIGAMFPSDSDSA